MIPKVIHYCWFGDKQLSELAEKCIESWRLHCPDYEIKCWNETNIDVDSVPYMKEAYDAHAWGFVPDVARLQIIYKEGGIYLDTDVEVIKSFDDLINNHAFMGLEDGNRVALGLGFGAEPHNEVVRMALENYYSLHFMNPDGSLNRVSSPTLHTSFMKTLGFVERDIRQNINGCEIYPQEYFCPLSYKTGICNITQNTHSIHHYDGAWLTPEEKAWDSKRQKVMQKFGKKIGTVIWAGARFFRMLHQKGIKNTLNLIFKRVKQYFV